MFVYKSDFCFGLWRKTTADWDRCLVFDLLPAPSDLAASKLAEMGLDDHVDDLHSRSRTMMREWQIVWEAQKVE